MFGRLESAESIRRNGLQQPWNGMQLLAWLIYVSLLVYFFALIFPLLWSPGVVGPIVSVIMCASAVAGGIFGFLTASTDPADEAVLNIPVESADRVLCYLCDVRVYFLALIAAVTTETLLLFAITLTYIIEDFGNFGNIRDRANEAFAQSFGGALGLRIILVACGFILLSIVALVLQLAGFHAMLVYKNLTTYDYIVGEQKRQREKKASKRLELQNKARAGDKKTVPQSQIPMGIEAANPECAVEVKMEDTRGGSILTTARAATDADSARI